MLQPQQIPSQDQSLQVARSPRYSSCYRAPSPHGPKLIMSTRGHAQLQANTLILGVSSTCNPQRVTALAPPPSSACKDGTNGGVRPGRSSQTLPSPTPHRFSSSHCHQLRDALCPPGTAPGTLHSAKLPHGALAGPVPRALGLRNHWFWKRNRISGNSSQDDAVMEAAPQARQMLSLNVLTWHHQKGFCPLPGAPVGSGLRLS